MSVEGVLETEDLVQGAINAVVFVLRFALTHTLVKLKEEVNGKM